MSVRNDNSSAEAMRARDAALAREVDRPAQPRPPAPAEHVDRFQQLMQHARGHGEAGKDELQDLRTLQDARGIGEQARADARASEDGVAAVGGDRGQGGGSGDRRDDAGLSRETLERSDVLALFQAQAGLRGDAAALPVPVAAPAANAQAMFDLVERHVRQMAVAGSGHAGDDDGQVLLRLSDTTLPGTDLLLTRTADGWSLRADVRSRDSFDAIREAAPELARRFAERNLGTLEIDPHYHA